MFSAIYRSICRTFGRVDSTYELELQVAEMRKRRAYVPDDKPPPTIFTIKCHPKTDEVCAELDDYFYKNWPWKDQADADKFLRTETNRWACLAIPNARDDRVLDSVKVNTLLFLLDETMSFTEGKAFYRRLTPIALGQKLPNRSDPYEWITYDIWANMRKTDPELTKVVWEGALLCIEAQVDAARLHCPDLGSLLRHRSKEGGIAFVAAVVRYAQCLHLTPDDIESTAEIHYSYGILGIIVNDILSFDKEMRAWKTEQNKIAKKGGKDGEAADPNASGPEGAQVLNMTLALAKDTDLDYAAAKRVLWVLCREWELRHRELVRKRKAKGGVSRDLEAYLEGLELVLGGNEWWSWYSERYQMKK
ncbi:MAG: hypothetical protein Q9223_005076 [Gallowayella weberi]